MFFGASQSVKFRIQGGLGNQLFQYAAGRAVATRLGVPLELDIRDYAATIDRHLFLDQFNIVGSLKTRGHFPLFKIFGLGTDIGEKYYQLFYDYVVEKSHGFHTQLLDAGPGTYFSGYWHNEKYFEPIATELRRELIFRNPASLVNQRIADQIQNTLSVSVHVRRGDYLSSPENAAIFAECSQNYYRSAAELIAKKCKSDLTFFLFSDDPEWTRANIKLPGQMEFVTCNPASSAFEDLRLMSLCKHNIIANSTFSWWGAWLNENSDKMAVAPKTWYRDQRYSNESINSASFVVIDNS